MLKVRSLSITHSAEVELTDISLTVGRGEVVAVIGPEDAGAALLLSAVANPDTEYLGEVIVSHYKAKSEPEKVRLMIGALNQPFEPPLHLTGFEYLELIGSFYGLAPNERAERIVSLANLLSCSRSIYTVMERVSPAVKQKVGLMASVISSPPVIIWDEPLLFLDPGGQKAVGELLAELTKSSTAVLLSSHNLELVEAVASNIVVLKHGQVAAEGSLTELARLAQTDKDLTKIFATITGRG